MEPRFTVHSRYNEKEAIRFNRALLFNVWHLKKTIIVSNIALLAMIVTSLIAHNYMQQMLLYHYFLRKHYC